LITWTQQYRIISNVFKSFHIGKKVNEENPFTQKELERNKLFLNPNKFQNYTLSNFKILIIYEMWKNMPSSKISFLKILNSLKEEDIMEFRKFKGDIESYHYIFKKDTDTLKTIDIEPYEAYKKKLIHPLTLGSLNISKNSVGIIGKKDVSKSKVLRSFFNF